MHSSLSSHIKRKLGAGYYAAQCFSDRLASPVAWLNRLLEVVPGY